MNYSPHAGFLPMCTCAICRHPSQSYDPLHPPRSASVQLSSARPYPLNSTLEYAATSSYTAPPGCTASTHHYPNPATTDYSWPPGPPRRPSRYTPEYLDSLHRSLENRENQLKQEQEARLDAYRMNDRIKKINHEQRMEMVEQQRQTRESEEQMRMRQAQDQMYLQQQAQIRRSQDQMCPQPQPLQQAQSADPNPPIYAESSEGQRANGVVKREGRIKNTFNFTRELNKLILRMQEVDLNKEGEEKQREREKMDVCANDKMSGEEGWESVKVDGEDEKEWEMVDATTS